mmetsp:Transcript_33733/g.60711  ORF Transcript_33733/g.60711 Transcript_33733/m.60711 type:complete len:231 (+) Transcript_33733:93-785(+)|eukprot:CAMPEP_0201956680 /NCGR_PEP_ID=MMETSP0904-20121228/4108_1 /ASSEMBLY_ACC=CAM_ASM_000553 /TAXON_ID=420261 /ORGANISM="Thalassiosira antarctica, Strain CCMP982" /LENGTH=230 /DNA_ID=CAMNT_0048501335 /DNA_START=12 /DNA_END=704 /DNA_ORIENTATION=+
MTKTKKHQSKPKQNNGAPEGAAAGRPKRKREVQVVVCPSAFPDFTTVGGSTSRRDQERRGIAPDISSKYHDKNGRKSNKKDEEPLALDVQETIREVHKFGAEGFTGVQKKSHTKSEYERLTKRTLKRQKIPTKIVVGMRKKALKREEREKQELKDSGVVSHHPPPSSGKKKREKNKKSEEVLGGGLSGVFGSNRARNTGDRRKMGSRSFGPAPDVGFMAKGMLKVKQPRR